MILRKLEKEKVELQIQAKRRQVCPTEESLLKMNKCAMADGRRIELKEEYSVSFKPQKSRPAGKRIPCGTTKCPQPIHQFWSAMTMFLYRKWLYRLKENILRNAVNNNKKSLVMQHEVTITPLRMWTKCLLGRQTIRELCDFGEFSKMFRPEDLQHSDKMGDIWKIHCPRWTPIP